MLGSVSRVSLDISWAGEQLNTQGKMSVKDYSDCHLPSQSSFLLTFQIFVNRQSIRTIDIYFGEHIKLDTIAIGKLLNHRLRIGFLWKKIIGKNFIRYFKLLWVFLVLKVNIQKGQKVNRPAGLLEERLLRFHPGYTDVLQYTLNMSNFPMFTDNLGWMNTKQTSWNKLVIPVFQTGCKETQEYEDHVQHTWSAVPPAACSSFVLNLRRTPHWQLESQIP